MTGDVRPLLPAAVPPPVRARTYDLVFVGAGASTAYVLLTLLAALEERPPRVPLRIGVVERDHAPFSGVAYGSRAARASLLITSLRDFLPEQERARFVAWLTANKHWVFRDFLREAGPYSSRWWARHREEIDRDEFDALYLPRYLFGVYLTQRTEDAIARARASGAALTEVIQDEVVGIEPLGDRYRVSCRTGAVSARRIVLATGSPPVSSRLQGQRAPAHAALIDDPFGGMGEALDRIRKALERAGTGGRPPHVVLIGGNAGTMDMLYQVNDLGIAQVERAVFTVLSPQGRLPEPIDDGREARSFRVERLDALVDSQGVRAATIYDAALQDIARGRAGGLAVTDMLGPIWTAVRRVLTRLSTEEALEFAGRWGVELGRHQRRAGWEYCEVVDQLTMEGRLRLTAGRFVEAIPGPDDSVRVRFEQAGRSRELELTADVVVNCGGPASRLTDSGSTLLGGLIERGVCRATPFGVGIAVDASLAAAPGLFVMGPLLAGNLVNGGPLWHMEHCGRISAFGSALGRDLALSV